MNSIIEVLLLFQVDNYNGSPKQILPHIGQLSNLVFSEISVNLNFGTMNEKPFIMI